MGVERIDVSNGIGYTLSGYLDAPVERYFPGSLGGGVDSFGLTAYIYADDPVTALPDSTPVQISFAFDSAPTSYQTVDTTVGAIRAAGSICKPNNYRG